MKALWIAADGTRHTVVGDTMLEIREKIENLRKELGKPETNAQHCTALTEEAKRSCVAEGIPSTNELPEHLKDMVKKAVQKQHEKPDPSKLN